MRSACADNWSATRGAQTVGGRFKWAAVVLLLPMAVAVSAVPASAGFLTGRACNQLQDEQRGLIANGVLTDIAQDPAVAAESLSDERKQAIARYFDIRGLITFRCTDDPRLRPVDVTMLPTRRPPEIVERAKAVRAAREAEKMRKFERKLKRIDAVAVSLAAASGDARKKTQPVPTRRSSG